MSQHFTPTTAKSGRPFKALVWLAYLLAQSFNASAATAQTTDAGVVGFRCTDAHGTRYQQWPCGEQAEPLRQHDARTASQTHQARHLVQRDVQLAASMAYAHKRQDRAAIRQTGATDLTAGALSTSAAASRTASAEPEIIRGKPLAPPSQRAILPKAAASSVAASKARR